MRLLDLTLPDAADNLALDEALLLAAEDGSAGEVLRLWENPALAVVLGSGGSVGIDVHEETCRADGVPVLRRASGGGTVVIGPHCLCFTVVLAYDRAPGLTEIRPSIGYVLGRVLTALRPVVAGATIEGISDLTADGVKFSGSAQQRKRRFFLHHGTILCDGFDLDRVTHYLKPPERQPEYRRDRPHAAFVTALPVDVAAVRALLVAEWEPAGECGPPPLDRMRELVTQKYGRDEWNRRR